MSRSTSSRGTLLGFLILAASCAANRSSGNTQNPSSPHFATRGGPTPLPRPPYYAAENTKSAVSAQVSASRASQPQGSSNTEPSRASAEAPVATISRAGSFTVEGYVLQRRDRSPIANAEVGLETLHAGNWQIHVRVLKQENGTYEAHPVFGGKTDKNGFFLFKTDREVFKDSKMQFRLAVFISLGKNGYASDDQGRQAIFIIGEEDNKIAIPAIAIAE